MLNISAACYCHMIDEASDNKYFSSALRIDVTPDVIVQSVINELIPLSMNSYRYLIIST